MQDFLVKQDETGLFDLRISSGDFATVDGFETAILVSLFTDGRAPASAVSDAGSRRGWVGDILTAGRGRCIGSRLLLYDESRLTRDIKNQVANAAERSLRWLVQDGAARSVSASVDEDFNRGVSIRIDITTNSGDVQSYAALWRRTSGANISRI
jgi:phage gp46-like protein